MTLCGTYSFKVTFIVVWRCMPNNSNIVGINNISAWTSGCQRPGLPSAQIMDENTTSVTSNKEVEPSYIILLGLTFIV